MNENLQARVVWSYLSEPSDAAANALIDQFGAEHALAMVIERTAHSHAPEDAVNRWVMRLPHLPDVDQVIAQANAAYISVIDPTTVPGMTDLAGRIPFVLWLRGDADALMNPYNINIDGARSATGYGTYISGMLTEELVAGGVTVHASGGYGIAASVHETALRCGGKTVAWLAAGVDRTSPAGHMNLFHQIRSTRGSALVSEMPPGTSPTSFRFIARKRLTAAATKATLLTEAGGRSGALISAREAHALGRNVGGVPGPITSHASTGVHALIHDGIARLVTTGEQAYDLIVN